MTQELSKILTNEDEIFCRVFVSTRNGALAYKRAFPEFLDIALHREESVKMLQRDSVRNRIAELEEASDEPYLITFDDHMFQLKRIRDNAIENKQMKAALEAEIQRGKLAGFYPDEAKITNIDNRRQTVNQIGEVSDDVRAKALAKVMASGGQP